MHVISTLGAGSVKDPHTEKVYEADADGVFRGIPLDFARELVTHHASQWREVTAHEAAQQQARVEQLRNPHLVAPTLADHGSRIEALEEAVKALEAAAKKAPRAPKAETATAAKRAPSKRTAAKKAAAAEPGADQAPEAGAADGETEPAAE